jgi:ribosome maturation factor RimP
MVRPLAANYQAAIHSGPVSGITKVAAGRFFYCRTRRLEERKLRGTTIVSTTLDQKITATATQAMAAVGLVLVQARLTGGTTGGRGKLTLNVMAERPDGTSPTLDECTKAARTLGAQLDVAEVINSPYIMEVGSPGLERPLITAADYARFNGKQAKLTLNRPVENPSGKGVLGTVIGIVTNPTETGVTMRIDEQYDLPLEYTQIRYANLLPSAEEMKQLMQQANSKQKETPHGA